VSVFLTTKDCAAYSDKLKEFSAKENNEVKCATPFGYQLFDPQ